MKTLKKIFIGLVALIVLSMIIPFFIPISKAGLIEDEPFTNSYFANVNDVSIHYRLWLSDNDDAKDNWILLVHGMGGSTYSWEQNAAFFAQNNFNVVAVDVPPFGYSDKSPKLNHSADNRALLLLDFLNTINPEKKWNLIGHSMGGGIVQAMSILNPEMTDKVVFVAPALITTPASRRHISTYLVRFRPIERIMVIVGEKFYIKPKRIEKMLHSSFGRLPSEEEVREYYRALSVPGTSLAIMRAFTNAKAINKICGYDFDKPFLAVLGNNDTWIPTNSIIRTLEEFNSGEIHIIDDAAHCPMETHAETFNKLVLSFLQEQPVE